nr:putative ribonuclease H-like domain-containing protein [Tanacetum cinerariifolium]
TPQQNRVAERRNKTLIEATRTMLADAKLPITFWAKAVHTACYVQNRVLVNKSQNKTPYELFNVVVAGTSSTNFSGTKDAASQDVKKDVSSLRYTALPNWFHEAYLDSSISNAQDACNADASESSGNSNPTATSTNSPADQMETLTVESAIPTVSSHVPTDCLDVFPEPSSTTRLILKRVTSQYETPSLDNILTLANRFEDILGVTTNTVDTNRVEADVSNMEYNISASPTPTFRIHKDHPKSQIIGPVDKPKKISDTLKDPSWVEAMQEELLQFKIQNVWILVDCPKGVRPIVYQMDVKSVFLYGTIDEEVYVMQPPGFQDSKFPDRVFKVEKAMYGLHQAPRAWYGTLSKYLLTNGFQRGTIDQTLFIQKHRGDFLLVQVHQVTPKECHLHAVKRIFRYLKGHPKLGLWYPKESPFDLVAYSDSDYGGATQDRKSTTEGDLIMARLAFCDYHNMIAILEKSEHNVDFHQIVDFVKASHIRIETSNEGTKILATIDGNPRTISESSIRRNLKLNDEAGISFLPDAELFENLALMEYNILPNQKFTFQKGQFSHQWKFLIYTIMQCLSPKSIGFNEFSSNIATAVGEGSGTPIEPHHTSSLEAQQSPHNSPSSPLHPTGSPETIPSTAPTEIPTLRQYSKRAKWIAQSTALPTAADEPASLLRDDSQGEAFPTVSGLEARQDRENIIKTSALPRDSTPRVTSLDADEENMQQQLQELTNLCTSLIKLLEDKDGGGDEPSREDATIKGRSLETGEEAGVEKSTERGSNDTEELVNVLTSMDAANILTSGVQAVSVPPVTEVSNVGVPTGSGLVPTVSAIFTTASVVTPYSRRKGKEKMVESDTPKKKKLQEQIDVQVAREIEEQMAREYQRRNEQIARDAEIVRIHAEEELKMMVDGLDRSNEVIARHLHEYEQVAADLTIGEKIELINELVKYQDHHAKIIKYQAQQSKPLSKREQKEFYMSVLKSHSGWKTKHFREEGERVKRKGIRLEQESAKKMKTSEEVSEEDLKEMMQLVPVEEV